MIDHPVLFDDMIKSKCNSLFLQFYGDNKHFSCRRYPLQLTIKLFLFITFYFPNVLKSVQTTVTEYGS